MKKIRIYESFAGIGSQYKALTKVSQKKNFTLEHAGISEWDVFANISYFRINVGDFKGNIKETEKELREHFSKSEYSLDSKILCKNVGSQNIEVLKKLREVEIALNPEGKAIPNIMNLKGQDIINRNVNLFTYSFPCQDLSTAGKGRGMKKGEGTRSGLLWEVERVLDEVNNINSKKLPKFLLMENVVNIVSKAHKEEYISWKEKLTSLGYKSYDGILDARDFGIPQSRRRFFCFSVLNDKTKRNPNLNELLKKYHKPMESLEKYLKVDYSIEKYLEEAIESTPNHTMSRETMNEKEKKICIFEGDKYKVNEEYTPTLTIKQDRWNNGGMLDFKLKKWSTKEKQKDMLKGNYSRYRLLTPRETFLLMGFNEQDFDNVKEENISKERLYRQAGNSIVVNVLEAIFEEFL